MTSVVKTTGNWIALAAAAGTGLGVGLTLLWTRYAAARQTKVWGEQPHPGWMPPQTLPLPAWMKKGNMVPIDPKVIGGKKCYPLIISCVVPRPVALVTTLSKTGEQNLAPFSYFTAFHDPPCVVICICRSGARDGDKKDTAQNIDDTGEFTVSVLSEWFLEGANHTCGNYDPGIDEVKLSGLTTLPSTKVKPGRIAESAVHMECKLKHKYEAKGYNGEDTCTVVIGEIVMFHAHENACKKTPSGSTYIGLDELQPIGRLGGNIYGRSLECFNLARPDRDWQNK